jgi:transposase
MANLVDDLVPDQLWAIVAPLLPPPPRGAPAGRPRPPDSGPSPSATALPRSCTWPAPPPLGGCCPPGSLAAARPRPYGGGWTSGPALACSTGSTWRSLTGSASRAGWTGHGRAWIRPACAPNAGDRVGANPVDRGKPGSKLHLVCDGQGLPLAAAVTAANVPDVTMLQAMVDDIPPIRTASGSAAHPARGGPRGQGLRQRRQPWLAAAAWDQAADRSAWGGVVGAAGAAAVEGRAGAVVAELL